MFESLSPGLNGLLFSVAAAAVWRAGTRLAGLADRIARQTGLGQGLVGILLLGGVTSLPEIAVATTASLSATPVLAVNDVLGSAAINVVILAAADARYGRNALTSTPANPEVLLQGTLGIVLLSLVVAAVTAGDRNVLGLGAWSWALLVAFLASVGVISRSQALKSWVPTRQAAALEGELPVPKAQPPGRLAAKTAAVGAVILGAGFVLARSGAALAEQTGLGTSFFGAVLLAASTSLPEVSTVLAAVKLRRYEMALADVLGTNLFNVSIIVLVDALSPGEPVLVQAGPFAAFAALLASVLTALYLVGLIERRDRTLLRMGMDSIAAIVVYVAGVAVLYQLR